MWILAEKTSVSFLEQTYAEHYPGTNWRMKVASEVVINILCCRSKLQMMVVY